MGAEVGAGGAGEPPAVVVVDAPTPAATLEDIKKVMLKPACFPPRKKTSSGGGFGRKKQQGKHQGKHALQKVEEGGDGETVETFWWEGHDSVLFLLYPNRIALRNALTRLSVFLEDPSESGRVVAPSDVRPGRFVAASYTGHNFRPADFARFASEARRQGHELDENESKLAGLLASEFPGYEAGGEGPGWGCIATARGLNKAEVAGTLLHESMHGLFYADEGLRRASWSFWEDLSLPRKDLWRGFLGSLGYDSSNEELCVNEMLAYLATERDLLRRYAARSEGGEGEGATLEVVQADFVRFVEGHIPEPKPRLRGQYTAYS